MDEKDIADDDSFMFEIRDWVRNIGKQEWKTWMSLRGLVWSHKYNSDRKCIHICNASQC
jgi:hypothetical protein